MIPFWLLVPTVFTVVAGVGLPLYFAVQQRKKKHRRDLLGAAMKLGLDFRAEDDSNLASKLHFVNWLQRGSEQSCMNLIRGTYKGEKVIAADFVYYSDIHTNRSSVSHPQYYNLTLLTMPCQFPELCISPENFFDKLLAGSAYEDIDFESLEFSNMFKVTSPNKKFAYDFCHARMIEYLLQYPDQILEVEGNTLIEIRLGSLKADRIQEGLDHLIHIRNLIPGYLLEQYNHTPA